MNFLTHSRLFLRKPASLPWSLTPFLKETREYVSKWTKEYKIMKNIEVEVVWVVLELLLRL